MKVDATDLDLAFEWAGSGSCAFISKKTGQTFTGPSEPGDDLNTLPEDIDDNPEQYIRLPTNYELGLDVRLVFDFVRDVIPDDFEIISDMFHRKGAYRRFNTFLDRNNKRDEWYEYKNKREYDARKSWCEENNIEAVEQ